MNNIYLETKRTIITNISENSYENVTKLFGDSEENFFALGQNVMLDKSSIIRRFDQEKNNKNIFNFVFHSKEYTDFIGYAKFEIVTKHRCVWFYAFIMEEKYRDMGFGSEILDCLWRFFGSFGNLERMYLSVLDRNEKAKKFWIRNNFIIEKSLIKSVFNDLEEEKINIYAKLY